MMVTMQERMKVYKLLMMMVTVLETLTMQERVMVEMKAPVAYTMVLVEVLEVTVVLMKVLVTVLSLTMQERVLERVMVEVKALVKYTILSSKLGF
ncbi:hypothetical protein EBS40_09595 [bacterium]|nr:hypothetical protein [bacterium]